MRYLVDGHNLIPHVPGLALHQLDDERRLVDWLQQYARVRRHTVEVFFDGAPPGQVGARSLGTVRAHFVALGRTADDAICQRLRGMGKRAREVRVVTADRRVQTEARAMGASVVPSPQFAQELLAALREAPSDTLPANDIDEWLKLFGEK